MKTAGGPMFEQYFRNAVLLVMEDPETGNTLARCLARPFEQNLSRSENFKMQKSNRHPILDRSRRQKPAGKRRSRTSCRTSPANSTSFLSNDIMRPIIAQENSTFNFREIMDNKKILLVNLSKGRLGDINANLIGLILVGKILMAALSRVDVIGAAVTVPMASRYASLPPFYLYIDEFQNVTTDSISTILSEARKYKLSLAIAHQFIAQLEEKHSRRRLRQRRLHRRHSASAPRTPNIWRSNSRRSFTAKDIMNIDNYNAYVKILAKGFPEAFQYRRSGSGKRRFRRRREAETSFIRDLW